LEAEETSQGLELLVWVVLPVDAANVHYGLFIEEFQVACNEDSI